MAFIMHGMSWTIVQKLLYLDEKIQQAIDQLRAVARWLGVESEDGLALSFAVAPRTENNVEISVEDVAGHLLRDLGNLVGWTLSSGKYDEAKPLIIDASNPEKSISKRKAVELVSRLAGAFEADSTVCLHLPNDILYPILVLAIWASKCRWTGTNIASTASELEHHFRISRTKYVITVPECEDTVRAAANALEWPVDVVLFENILEDAAVQKNRSVSELPGLPRGSNGPISRTTLRDLFGDPDARNKPSTSTGLRPDQVAVLQSTSGTTGLPKMAARTHAEMIEESKAIEDNNAQKPYEIRRLFCTPAFHAFTFPLMIIESLRLGIPTYIMRRYDDSFAQKVYCFRITETAAPPPVLKMLEERRDSHHLLQSLRLIYSGGAPLAAELRKRTLSMFENPVRIVQVWGMTEGGWFSTFKYAEDDDTSSVGRAIPGIEIKMSLDSPSLELPNGGIAGELLVRGRQVMSEYFENAEASQNVYVDDWLRTGDVGYIEHGKVYVVDRCKDLIKVKAWQVAPAEIEAAVLELPGVTDAAAIAAGYGVEEHPLLFIVPSHDGAVSSEAVVNHLLSRMAKHKVSSTAVEFIEAIPRNPSGKILRKMLRDIATQRGLT